MVNIKQQKKRILTNEQQRLRRKHFRSQVKTAQKKAYQAFDSPKINQAVKLLDKAVNKKIFHKNKSARLKSKLMRKANQAKK